MAASLLAILLSLGSPGQFGQSNTGELRLIITDASGLPLPGLVEIVSEANHLRQTLDTDPSGVVIVRRLPFGSYRIEIVRPGFADLSRLIEVRSALPAAHTITMSLAGLQAQVTVSTDATLLDPRQSSSLHRIGADTLEQRTTALPGRALPDLVNTQPGWLLEANGILHPRGSEYQTQYVVDGLPMTDNRSPVFAPEPGADDVQALTIMTGGYPAEYGRKLGGVIEITTIAPARRGLGAAASASLGSFDTRSGDASVEYGRPKTTLSLTAAAAETGRYLDPPVEENHTNHGSAASASVRLERDLTEASRFGVILRHANARFLVPNEHVQQEAGQRQDRDSSETAAQFSAQRIFSPTLVGDVRAMAREVSAGLWSNAQSTPIVVSQDRGFRELYVKATVSAHAGAHELKAGADFSGGPVRERLDYRITDRTRFDNGTPEVFTFAERRSSREESLFVQDQIHAGAWTLNAGLRWDRYRLALRDSAISPRLAAAWNWAAADLVLRAAYDRAFQTPAIENLLIASSASLERAGGQVLRLPVPASRGHFFEAGLSKSLAGRLRLDASLFTRRITDVADDDLLLDTGVSFPIAFHRAEINGAEFTLELRRWKHVSGSLGYSRLHGVGQLPITGGLFLGEEAASQLASTERFPVTQDQRHTIRGRAAYQWSSRGWMAVAGSYGSGLPFEDFDDTPEEAVEQFGRRVVERVNFKTGRVRPSASLDLSAGFSLSRSTRRGIRVQAEIRNLTNRLDVINFAGLFSGTAIAPPRTAAVRLRFDFH